MRPDLLLSALTAVLKASLCLLLAVHTECNIWQALWIQFYTCPNNFSICYQKIWLNQSANGMPNHVKLLESWHCKTIYGNIIRCYSSLLRCKKVFMRPKYFLCAVDEWLFYVDYMINMEIRSLSWPCKAPEFVYVSLAAVSAAPFFQEHWQFNH